MSPFLRNIEARTLAEREARLVFTPGRRLPKGTQDGRNQYEGPGGDQRSPQAIAERNEKLKLRAARVLELRAMGLLWTEIGKRLAISPRAARHAVTRLETR